MRIAILAAALAVSGCVVTPDDLRSDPSTRTLTGTAPTPVEITYRHLVTRLRKCYDQSGMIISTDYFPDVKQGRVDVFAGPGLAHAAIDLTQDGAGTAVKARYSNPLSIAFTDQAMKASIVAWANNEPGFCMFTPTIPADDRSRQ